jgi:hypothetical protein
LNPTVLFVVVVVVWAVIDVALPGPWIVTLLVTAAAVKRSAVVPRPMGSPPKGPCS